MYPRVAGRQFALRLPQLEARAAFGFVNLAAFTRAVFVGAIVLAGTAAAEPVDASDVAAGRGSSEVSFDAAAPEAAGGMSVVSYIGPAAVAPPRGRDTRSKHWTLREPVYMRVSAGDVAPAGTVSAPVHAGVSMFSWREIAVAALIVALALGGLLAFTGGGNNQRPRHY